MRSSIVAWPLLLLVLVASVPALAQGSDDEGADEAQGDEEEGEESATPNEIAVARKLFREGVAAAQNGNWIAARDSFKSSFEIAPRPTTLLNLAGSYAKTDQLVEAVESYRLFIRMATSGTAQKRKSVAEEALLELEPRLPMVRFEADGLEPDDVITLDDKDLAAAAMTEEIPVNAGSHELVVRREGYPPLVVQFVIQEREHRIERVAARAGVTWDPLPGAKKDVKGAEGDQTTTPLRPPPPEAKDDDGILASPFFWVGAAVVLIGGGVLAYVLLQDDQRDPYTEGNLNPFLFYVD